MNVDKSPDPDGLTAGFYKNHWCTIKSAVVSFIQHFFNTAELDPVLICLIPKIEFPTEVRDYRPISLSNVAYKLISKVLDVHLKPLLQDIISENQTAFIPCRLITDNVLIAHELLYSIYTRKLAWLFMAVKLDINKAFDKIEWYFIAEKWCQWIMAFIN